MMQPQLLYTKIPSTDEIGCLVSLVPTFERTSAEPQDVDIKFDEEPDSSSIWPGDDFCFIFLVDRSCSMSGERIQSAKSALKIFIRSLPTGCSFSIISFGSTQEYFRDFEVVKYDEDSMKDALEQIESFDADLGGTDILTPLEQAQYLDSGTALKKRVFILTDGQVSDSQAVARQAASHSETVRVFTFGLGNDCDKVLCEDTARSGRGTCSFVDDRSTDLNGQVIRALKFASQPSLKDCFLSWSGEYQDLKEVFRNQSVFSARIIAKDKLDQLDFGFLSKEDPLTKQPIALNFRKHDFTEVTGEDGKSLAKFIVFKMIEQSTTPAIREQLSLKHQVLCDETALVGVVKQENKSILSSQEVVINFNKHKEVMPQPRPEPSRQTSRRRAAGLRATGHQTLSQCGQSDEVLMRGAALDERKQSGSCSYKKAKKSSGGGFFSGLLSKLSSPAPPKSAAAPQTVAQKQSCNLVNSSLAEEVKMAEPIRKEGVKPAVSASRPKPTFEDLISRQTNVGSWAGSHVLAFAAFFKDGNYKDAGVMQALDGLSGVIKNKVDKETLYATLLAILVLTEFFAGREDEWTLLVGKAKTFLKNSGIAKPAKVIQKFSLQQAQ